MVFANGKAFDCFDGKHYRYDNTWDCVFVEENKNPKKYFDYCGSFLSVSTEGPLYDIINCNDCSKDAQRIEQEMSDIFAKYGYYYELGDSWNFSLYEN